METGVAIQEITQLLTFNLGEESFAVEVGKVREVLELGKITRVPQSPDFLRGVINLRGRAVPVVDMRVKFGFPRSEDTIETGIIVAEIGSDEKMTVLGMLVDSVDAVVEFEPHQIEPAPKIGIQLDTEFIQGLGKREEQFVIILDIDKIFKPGELSAVTEAGEELS
ncbi:MAG: chemotaxis protein CheW [Spirochaetota bacterium]